ncbi:28414_t:CDS:2, partial [Racocetra persica]
MEQKYKHLGWKDFGVEYLENNCDKTRKVRFASWFGYTINANGGLYGCMSDTFQIYKLACEKALRHTTKSSTILQEAYKGFDKIPDVWAPMAVRGGKQRTQYISTVSLKFISSTEINPVSSNKQKIEKRLNLFQSYNVDNIEWTDPLSFGFIIDRDSDMIFGKLLEDQRKNLRKTIDLPYHKFEMSLIISKLVKVLLERSKSLNKKKMIVSLPPISMDFQENDEEFE